MQRRHFLKSAAGATALAALSLHARSPARPASTSVKHRRRKGFGLNTLRTPTARKLSVLQKFRLLRDAGFDGVEVPGSMNQDEVLAARDATGLVIPSVTVATHWKKPLTDPDPTVRQLGLDGLLQALRDAKAYGADSVLLVPAVVKKEVSYTDAYRRSQAEIRKAIPLAESLGVAIALENVWNHFLLSPLEAVQYVDSFRTPAVRWHMDAGNVVNTGWPEHWIRDLGERIVKVHVKEYSRSIRDARGPRAGFQVDLLEGDTDWPAVNAALDEVGYQGWMITEQYRPPAFEDDAAWLVHLSQKLDQVLVS